MMYRRLRCVLPAELEDELPSLLEGQPILGVDVGAVADGKVAVTVFIARDCDGMTHLVYNLLTSAGGREIRSDCIADADWLSGFREGARPVEVGSRWWIDPHPLAPTPAPIGRTRLVIEPRTAFGSGSHQSTQLMLSLLERVAVTGVSILDIGTGTGILAVAAEALGGGPIVALDNDAQAIWVARETAAQQDWRVGVRYLVGETDCLLSIEFGIICCNMIYCQLEPLLPEMRRLVAPTGRLILSGFASADIDPAVARIRGLGMEIEVTMHRDDWAGVIARVAASDVV